MLLELMRMKEEGFEIVLQGNFKDIPLDWCAYYLDVKEKKLYIVYE